MHNVTKKKQNLTQNYIFSIRKRIEKMKIEDYTLLYKEKRVTENMNSKQDWDKISFLWVIYRNFGFLSG